MREIKGDFLSNQKIKVKAFVSRARPRKSKKLVEKYTKKTLMTTLDTHIPTHNNTITLQGERMIEEE